MKNIQCLHKKIFGSKNRFKTRLPDGETSLPATRGSVITKYYVEALR